MNPYTSSILLTWIVILLWLMLSTVWTTKILLYFFFLLLPFLLLLASISPSVCWNPPLLFSFFYFDFSTSSPSLCFLKRFFNFPISKFKLLVKNVRHTCGLYYCILPKSPSTLHVGFTSPHLSFSYLLSILFFILIEVW